MIRESSGIDHTYGTQEKLELKRKCSAFEAIFLNHLLEATLKSVEEEGEVAEDLYKSMAHQALAKSLSEKGVFGIGRLLYEELAERYPPDSFHG